MISCFYFQSMHLYTWTEQLESPGYTEIAFWSLNRLARFMYGPISLSRSSVSLSAVKRDLVVSRTLSRTESLTLSNFSMTHGSWVMSHEVSAGEIPEVSRLQYRPIVNTVMGKRVKKSWCPNYARNARVGNRYCATLTYCVSLTSSLTVKKAFGLARLCFEFTVIY